MSDTDVPRVLFLCTGNFYRSRFAEALFNHRARECGLPWRAFSRGLRLHPSQSGLSPLAVQGLNARAIDLEHTAADCASLSRQDLESADLIIALCEQEHRPMVVELFPEWEWRVRFWNVFDNDLTPADEALPQIERNVLALLDELQAS